MGTTRILACLWACAAAIAGCAGPGMPAQRMEVYRPGDSLLLRWRAEMHYSHDGADNLEWAEFEMPVEAGTSADGNGVLLSIRGRRMQGGYECKGPHGSESKAYDTSRPASDYEKNPVEYEDLRKSLRSIQGRAILAPGNRLQMLDANGRPINTLMSPEEAGEELQRYVSETGMLYTYPALCQSVAYLPPPDARPGQEWTVERDDTAPGHQFGFGMLTQAAGLCFEKSICRFRRLERTREGVFAIITIQGTRWPRYSPGQTKRVPSMSVEGELRLNLTTGRIRSLRIESSPSFADPNDARSFRVKFVDAVSTE
jgi:hypothetical protein